MTQRAYKMALKKKERVGWKEQCSAIDNLRDSAKMFKILSKDPVQLVGSLQLPSGNYTDTLDETYRHLVATHFPGSRIVEEGEPLPDVPLGTAVSDDRLIQEIVTDDRIIWAVNSFASFKSPGEDWIFFMLKSRIVVVRYGETKLTIITKGFPQGGVLPPLLWCMVIDSLIELLNSLGHKTEGFSDDLATILRGKFVPTLCDIQGILNKVSSGARKMNLR